MENKLTMKKYINTEMLWFSVFYKLERLLLLSMKIFIWTRAAEGIFNNKHG